MSFQAFSRIQSRKKDENADLPPISGKPFLPLALLMLAGFWGNYYTIPLFFGADFLFGSVATLLILNYYGFFWGVLAAVIANSYTFILWGHPYGFINFKQILPAGSLPLKENASLILSESSN